LAGGGFYETNSVGFEFVRQESLADLMTCKEVIV
jgi:hypothetical protein